MSDDSAVWQIVAVVGLISAAWSLLLAARSARQSHELDPPTQARSIALSYLAVVAFVVALGLEVQLPAALAAFAVGVAAGFFIAWQAGYIDDYGDVFAKGSAWYLVPVAFSVAIVIYGVLEHDDADIALGLLGGYMSLGIGTGQLLFSYQTVSRVTQAWDAYFDSLTLTADGAAFDALTFSALAVCANGHAVEPGQRFCSECGAPAFGS